MQTTISIKTAAKLLGVGEQTIRVGLQRNILDFGYAIKPEGENHNYVYTIPLGRFCAKTGIDKAEVMAAQE